nr:MAG TPA: hypothetical protein [Caudoviricetes sp.]
MSILISYILLEIYEIILRILGRLNLELPKTSRNIFDELADRITS